MMFGEPPRGCLSRPCLCACQSVLKNDRYKTRQLLCTDLALKSNDNRSSFSFDLIMPQQNDCFSILSSESFVSNIDYSEAQQLLHATVEKQKDLRRRRSPDLFKQVLLKRTYTLVCDLLDSDCSTQIEPCPSSPLSTVENSKKRPWLDDDRQCSPSPKKSKSLMDRCYDITKDDDVLRFLRELNSVKMPSSRY